MRLRHVSAGRYLRCNPNNLPGGNGSHLSPWLNMSDWFFSSEDDNSQEVANVMQKKGRKA